MPGPWLGAVPAAMGVGDLLNSLRSGAGGVSGLGNRGPTAVSQWARTGHELRGGQPWPVLL